MRKSSMKRITAYLLTIIILLSAMFFPDVAQGKDNSKNLVAIKTYNERYWSAEDGGGGKLSANRGKVDDWEIFEIVDLGKEYVALKSHNGKYVSVQNESKKVKVDADKIGKWETFKLVILENNKVAFKANNNLYICAEDGGGKELVADRKKLGNWETFKLIELKEGYSDKCKLEAIADEKGVAFTWTKPFSPKKIIGYNLYRGTSPGKQSNTPISDFPIEGTSHLDKNLNSGTAYYYVVKAVYKDKTLGPASNEVSVILKEKITLSGKTAENGVSLSWTKPSTSSNILGYNLYRGTSSGKQSSTPITDFYIEGTSYIDKNVEYNTTYYYVLKAVYKDKTLGESSNEVKLTSGSVIKNIVLEVGSKYMYVNGHKREIDPGKGTVMIIKNGRTFLPIRSVIEAMGGEVGWNETDKRVSIYLKNSKIHLWIGNKIARVNNVSKESDVAPYISDSGRTMLPLRFIAENLDCEVDWDGINKRVTIIFKD